MGYMEIIIGGIFVNNILLAQFLGNCPFLGTSKKMETAVGMAMAVVFVLVLAGVITWLIYAFFLVPYKLVYMRTIAFILVIASLVQFVEMFLKKSIPALYAGLGIFLPLITTNCAVFGACILNVDKELNFMKTLVAVNGLCRWIWPGPDSLCRCPRTHHSGQGSETASGYVHRLGNCRHPVPYLLCFQRDDIDYIND